MYAHYYISGPLNFKLENKHSYLKKSNLYPNKPNIKTLSMIFDEWEYDLHVMNN